MKDDEAFGELTRDELVTELQKAQHDRANLRGLLDGMRRRAAVPTWLLSVIGTALLGVSGTGWAIVQKQINDADSKASQAQSKQTEQGSDIAVIKEQIKNIQRDVEETKSTTRETNRKIDELKDLIRRGR